MTKLIITENLISDINQIKSEINIDESIVSISQEEFTANNTAALFQSDNFQFVSDSFVTYSDLKKMNYDFNEKYIFQVKKVVSCLLTCFIFHKRYLIGFA